MKEKDQAQINSKQPVSFGKFLGWFLIVIVLAANSYLIWQMQGVVGRVDQYNKGVVDEIGGMKADLKDFADDMTEIRKFLLLPPKQYSVNGEQAPISEEQVDTNSDTTVALYAMLNSVTKEKQAQDNRSLAEPIFAALLVNQDFLKGLVPADLALGERADLQIKFNDTLIKNPDGSDNLLKGQPLYSLIFDAEGNAFKVQSSLGEYAFQNYKEADFATKLLTYLSQNSQPARLKKLEKQIKDKQDEENAVKQVQQNLEDQKKQLADALHEAAFRDGLAALGWKVADQSREESNKYIFDILDVQGKTQFSIALEISSGMVKLIKNGQEIDLKNFLDSDGSKKKS